MEAEGVEAVKFLWKRKHFEERSWKRKANLEATYFIRNWKRKQKYSTASTSLLHMQKTFKSRGGLHLFLIRPCENTT